MCHLQAAEQGHGELCALLLRHSPALASVRDAKGRCPRDVAHPAVQDLLGPWRGQSHGIEGNTVPPDAVSNG